MAGNAKTLRNPVPEQLREKIPYLFRRMVGRVQAEGNLPCITTHSIHQSQYLFRVRRITCAGVCFELFYSHIYLFSILTEMSPGTFNASMPFPSICPILTKSLLEDQLLQKIATFPQGT